MVEPDIAKRNSKCLEKKKIVVKVTSLEDADLQGLVSVVEETVPNAQLS